MNTGKIVAGVIAAAAAGVVVGMLYAPAKGSVTRKKLSRKSNRFTDDANDSFTEFTDTLSEEFDSIKKSASDLLEKGKEKAASSTWAKHSK